MNLQLFDRLTSYATRFIMLGGLLAALFAGAGGCLTKWFDATVTEIVDQWLASQGDSEVQPRKEIQRDVLRRVAGNRHVMTETCTGIHSSGEPFVALNEAFLSFADEPDVLEALEALWEDGDSDERDNERVVALIKRMATAAGISIVMDDAFLDRPFAPIEPSQC